MDSQSHFEESKHFGGNWGGCSQHAPESASEEFPHFREHGVVVKLVGEGSLSLQVVFLGFNSSFEQVSLQDALLLHVFLDLLVNPVQDSGHGAQEGWVELSKIFLELEGVAIVKTVGEPDEE